MFDRWGSVVGRTIALHNFKMHHTQINDIYWSFVPVYSYVVDISRKSKCSDAHVLFNVSDMDARRVALDKKEWIQWFEEFDNMNRLNCLLNVCAYFEVYIRHVVRASVLSYPDLHFKKSKAIDGVSLLKEGTKISLGRIIKKITQGRWEQRVENYGKLFGDVPTQLRDAVGDLDEMRGLRNSVGHAFGRDIDKELFDDLKRPEIKRVSKEMLKRYLGLVDTLAAAIDEHLLKKYIGEFELISYYHKIHGKMRSGGGIRDRAVIVKKSIGEIKSIAPLSKGFWVDLIKYYDNV
jgi:hypothetical protein